MARGEGHFDWTFERRVAGRIDFANPLSCWVWTGSKTSGGYGQLNIGDRRIQAHRFVFEYFRGEIPEGLQLDHLCRNRPCVNPDHLEPVTPSENTRRSPIPGKYNLRKTHCPQGHEYTPENTTTCRRGSRSCRECGRKRARERARRIRAERRSL